jgi:hypothetical protein
MLGEMIGETHGKRVVRRILPSEGPTRVEVSFEDGGQILGVDLVGGGTYCATLRPDGMLLGEGQGISTTREGEVVTWKGSGLGKVTGGGAVSYRGILYFQTACQKLAHLNSIAVVFEHDADPSGNMHSKYWEWK